MEISIQNLSYVYRSPISGEHRALENISFDIPSKEIVAIIGSTGSGKTTLLQHLNGLLLPTSGKILFDGKLIRGDREWTRERKRIGLVFQFPEYQLFEETVEEDVSFGPRNRGMSGALLEERVKQALSMVGMDKELFGRRSPFHLSGGEQRRVAIAGILAMEPEVLVLDEPTAALDTRGAAQVEHILESYHSTGRTVVFASHDMELVARLASRVAVLEKGQLRYYGNKAEAFQDEKLMDETGLAMPQVPAFMRKLRGKGIPVLTECYTVEQAREAMNALMRKDKRR